MKQRELTLSPEGIDSVSDLIQEEMQKHKAEKKEIIRLRLSVEEVLLTWSAVKPNVGRCSIRYGKRGDNFVVTLFCLGKKCNPLEQQDVLDEQDELGVMINMLLELNLAPTYSYRNRMNSLTFKVRLKQEQVPVGIIWAILGAVTSFFAFRYMPSVVGETVYTYLTYPVQEALMNWISLVTGPVLFLAVITGIIRTDNVSTIRRRGGRMLSSFTIQMFLAAIVTILVCFLGFEYQWNTVEGATISASVFIELLVDIVPATIFAPFIDGNALQLVFLSIISGVALIMVRDKIEGLC